MSAPFCINCRHVVAADQSMPLCNHPFADKDLVTGKPIADCRNSRFVFSTKQKFACGPDGMCFEPIEQLTAEWESDGWVIDLDQVGDATIKTPTDGWGNSLLAIHTDEQGRHHPVFAEPGHVELFVAAPKLLAALKAAVEILRHDRESFAKNFTFPDGTMEPEDAAFIEKYDLLLANSDAAIQQATSLFPPQQAAPEAACPTA